jgi:uncharacterized protein (DUF3820 family)
MSDLTIPFGKHKGEDIEDIPTEYLEWFLSNVDTPPVSKKELREKHLDLCSAIEDELASRKKYGR